MSCASSPAGTWASPRPSGPGSSTPSISAARSQRNMPSMQRAARRRGFTTLALLAFAGCQNVQTTEELPVRTPGSTDAGAGGWRMLVLSSPTQIAVPPPAAATSDAYRAELAAIKDAQAGLTQAQKD